MVETSDIFPGGIRAVMYIRDSENFGGWYYRNIMLEWAPVEDSGFKSRVVYDVYSSQEEKGYWNPEDDVKLKSRVLETARASITGRHLVHMAYFGVARNERHIKRALGWLLERDTAYDSYNRRKSVWGEQWVALHAALLWGRENEKPVQQALRCLVQNEKQWLGKGNDNHADAMRIIMASESKFDSPTANRGMRWFVKNQRADGTWPRNNFFNCLDVIASMPRSVAEPMVEKALPKIQKLQRANGSWDFPAGNFAPMMEDEWHVHILECLVRFGFVTIP